MSLIRTLSVATVVFALAAAAPADPKTTHTGVVRSARIELRYRPGSLGAATADRTSAEAERCLERIDAALECKTKGPFQVYVYDELAELVAITGTNGNAGFSTGTETHVPVGNDQTLFHELVHLVAATFPKSGDEPRNLFFAEGLANSVLEHVDGVHVHAVASLYFRRNMLPALSELTTGDFYAWLRAHPHFNAYDVGASWMRFLLDRFGAAKVKQYYTGMPAKAAFGMELDALEKAWREFVGRYPLRPETETLLRSRVGESPGFEPFVRGLPPDIVGEAKDWTPLLGEKLTLSDLKKWNREDGVVTGTNPEGDWTTCEFGATKYEDCAVRARIRTSTYCALRVQIGRDNQAMLVQGGTFQFRNDVFVSRSTSATMNPARRETDFVVVRRGDKFEVWIDGAKALAGTAVRGAAVVGIGVAQGSAQFTDVRVRKLLSAK